MSRVLKERSAGILLHPTSLPGEGIGSINAVARHFLDWLADADQSFWQILPLVAVTESGSPYNGISAVAGNPLLIDLEDLAGQGLLDEDDLRGAPGGRETINFAGVFRWKNACLQRAHRAWRQGSAPSLTEPFQHYRAEHADWLADFALFRALHTHFRGAVWSDWEPGLRERDPSLMQRWREHLSLEIERTEFEQFLFDRQWSALREYANRRGIRIIGDLPIFVDHNSADVWAHQDLFCLDQRGTPEVVSGVPPDYFSKTGQRWGNPLYRWDRMRERGFVWWTQRFRRMLQWVDMVRVDHFRGFDAYWEIPAAEETALNGHWRPGPGAELFHEVERRLGELPVIAEDLGLITAEVEALRDGLGFPGMRVFQFAFDGDPKNPHLPENHPPNAVAYTGTHDNDTALGWWRSASPEEKVLVRRSLGRDDGEIHWAMIETIFRSPANLAIVPLQDVLGLGSEARMNTPGTSEANWAWRFSEQVLTEDVQRRLRELTRVSNRTAKRNLR